MEAIPTTIKSRKLVQEKREQIILAAIKKFPQKGFIKTTLQNLAEESGISHANIYDYVGNKEDIFVLVHEFITNLADQGLDECIKGIKNPLEKLKRMIRAEFDLSYKWSDAILFVYQDIHILKKSLLRELLEKESHHVARFKRVLDECVEKGVLRSCNTRVAANLVKIMVDSWVIKRWDLKGVSQAEMENSILNLVFNGLLNDRPEGSRAGTDIGSLEGKSVLLLNGGTPLGRAVSLFLCSKGARLGIYTYETREAQMELAKSAEEMGGKVELYPAGENGDMTPRLFKKIADDFGQIDIFLQDLGASDFKCNSDVRIDENLRCARGLSGTLEQEMSRGGSGRIVFLTPWAWYAHVNSLRYETAKAEAIAMTRTLAGRLSRENVTVNCVVPGYITSRYGIFDDDEGMKAVLKRVSSKGRLGEMADVVEAVHFLISDSSKYLTGQILSVNGGNETDGSPLPTECES